MMFPAIHFDSGISPKAQKLYTYIVHTCSREYFRDFEVEQPRWEVTFTTGQVGSYNHDVLADSSLRGFAMEISGDMPSFWEASGEASKVAHDSAHVVAARYMKERGDANIFRKANNAIHYAIFKDKSYTYSKRYGVPPFFQLKYGLPWITITYPDVRRVLTDYDVLAIPEPDGKVWI